MPTFSTDIDIDVEDFISECSEFDIKEMIEALQDHGYIKPKEVTEKLGTLESEFFQKIDKLKNVFYILPNDEIEYIDSLVNKYC